MKKGSKFRPAVWKFKTHLTSGYYLSAAGFALACFVSLSVAITNFHSYFVDRDTDSATIINIAVSCVSFAVALYCSISSVIKLHRDFFSRQFLEQEDYAEKTKQSVITNISVNDVDNGFKWLQFDGTYYLCSENVDNALFKRADKLLLSVTEEKRKMNADQRQALYQIVNAKIAQGKNIFNGELVGLRTDMFLNGVLADINEIKNIGTPAGKDGNIFRFKNLRFVNVAKTDYFANLTTNDLIFKQLFKYDFSDVYCGKAACVNEDDVLYNLSQSPAANIIGVNTIAITHDGKLIINKQKNNNDVNNNCFVPSGSGSSDFDDLKNCIGYKNEKIIELYERKKAYNCELEIATDKSQISGFERKKEKDIDAFDNLTDKYFTAEKAKIDCKAIKKYIEKSKKYSCDFNEFITYGMARELAEESHIVSADGKDKIKQISKLGKTTYICGYIRLMDRGGKPDFFGLTLLEQPDFKVKELFGYGKIKYTKKEFIENHSITDYTEVCKQIYVPMEKFLSFKDHEEFRKYLNGEDGKSKKQNIKISLQLYYSFYRLKKLFAGFTLPSDDDYFTALKNYLETKRDT